MDVGVDTNIEGGVRLVSEIDSPSPAYIGGSQQVCTYAPSEVPTTTDSEILGSDSIYVPKDQLQGNNEFRPSEIPEGNSFQSQMPLSISGDGGGYRTLAVMPETLWHGQGVGFGMGSEWQDQEKVMQILQTMDGGWMGNG